MRKIISVSILASYLLITCLCSNQLQAAGIVAEVITVVKLDHAPKTKAEHQLPLVMWSEKRTEPDPLSIQIIRIDLTAPTLEVVAMLADDPDGAGPAEAALDNPVKLAARNHALVAVNANAFAGIPDAKGKIDSNWRLGLPVDIAGAAAHAGILRSGKFTPPSNDLCFWMDNQNKPHIGPFPDKPEEIKEAVNAWWGDLVADGKVLPPAGGDRHPRTIIGINNEENQLFLVVVDGRQPQYSVGMTSREEAELMVSLGCKRAINLDGGGSSIMLVSQQEGKMDIVNRPSQFLPRPVPILIGVRIRQIEAEEK